MRGPAVRLLCLYGLLLLGGGVAVADPLPPTTAPAAPLPGAPAQPGSQVVAEVDGRPVTLADVGDAIRALPPSMAALPFDVLFPAVRDQLVTEQAVVNRAHQAGLDDDPTVRRRMRAASDRVLADTFVQQAADATVTEAALRARYAETIAGKAPRFASP
ncbi:MAG: hypothetical protein J0H57_07505 [Rhodospirillales bacterium]|nr:hypothetical protein [Rhodospirillales bacterium]